MTEQEGRGGKGEGQTHEGASRPPERQPFESVRQRQAAERADGRHHRWQPGRLEREQTDGHQADGDDEHVENTAGRIEAREARQIRRQCRHRGRMRAEGREG